MCTQGQHPHCSSSSAGISLGSAKWDFTHWTLHSTLASQGMSAQVLPHPELWLRAKHSSHTCCNRGQGWEPPIKKCFPAKLCSS